MLGGTNTDWNWPAHMMEFLVSADVMHFAVCGSGRLPCNTKHRRHAWIAIMSPSGFEILGHAISASKDLVHSEQEQYHRERTEEEL